MALRSMAGVQVNLFHSSNRGVGGDKGGDRQPIEQ